MPCGGIYPVCPQEDICFYCGKTGLLDHFCDEWDTGLHAECVEPFLKTEEGKVVLAHGHRIIVRINNQTRIVASGSDTAKPIITK